MDGAALEAEKPVLSVGLGVGLPDGGLGQKPSSGRSPWRFDLTTRGQSVVTPASSKANHSPTLAALPDGRLAMAWFGGSREGARDVQIYFSRFDGERWEDGRAIISTDGFIASTGRYITKLGNPVLHSDGARLNLWFVAVSLGGWGGARLNHSWSEDQGQTWSIPRLMVTSPFLNVSTLVRSAAISSHAFALSDSKVSRETLLPAYFELGRKYPVMLRLNKQGRLLDRYPFAGVTGLLQPSIVVSTQKMDGSTGFNSKGFKPLVAYFRRARAVREEYVFSASSVDGGYSWSQATPMGIPNGDASVAAWADGLRTWVVANPSPKDRRSIATFAVDTSSAAAPQVVLLPSEQKADLASIAHSTVVTPIAPSAVLDEASLTAAEAQEFSYPSFAQTSDGRLHLAYTADGRRTIRHRIWRPQP